MWLCEFRKRLKLIRILVVVLCVFVEVSVMRVVDLTTIRCGLVCKDPQPRAVRLAELLNITTKVIPYMAVIHRCDEGSGCCVEKETICAVADFQTIHIEVFVSVNNKYRKDSFFVTNHTECSCQHTVNDIK